MSNAPLTLSELSERSGVEIRTLRSWIQQGVVPGPETVGRNARYAPDALTRARAAKAMRDLYGMSLSAIRQDLLAADEAKITAYAAIAEPTPAQPNVVGETGQPAPQAAAPAPAGTSAADYLHKLRSAGVFGAGKAPAARASSSPLAPGIVPAPISFRRGRPARAPAGSRLTRLAEALEQIAGARPSRRKAKGEVRLHIPITPDLELTVRGDHTPQEIARYEQIADLLRGILTGGLEP